MLKSYLATALRALGRHKGYAAINVSGLAVGLACCLLILVYVLDELSYDQFHERSDRIVRVAMETKSGDGEWRGGAPTFYALADLVNGSLSGVEQTARLARDRALLRAGDTQIMEDDILMADASAFDIFTIPFVRGNPKTAFDNPYSAVLSEKAARMWFGDEDPIGQTLLRNNEQEFEVTGVVRAMPVNSHFHFDVLLNLESTKDRYDREMFESLGAQWVYTYVLLERPEPVPALATRLNDMARRIVPPDTPVEVRLAVQPLADIHLHSRFASEIESTGDIRYLYIFGAIAVFILVIACVNFMNLATARASMRAREVGVRKLLGAHRGQLVRQFLGESVGMSLFAVVLAPVAAALAVPFFNAVSGKAISAGAFVEAPILLGLLGIALSVGLLAGIYPAFFLSSFQPARVLKGAPDSGGSGAAVRLRQGLVVLQFGISIAIVIGTLIVSSQLDYMQTKNPGFDRDQVVSVRVPATLDAQRVETLKEAFLDEPGVLKASAASHAPPDGLNSWRLRPAGSPVDAQKLVSWVAVDADYVETLGLTITAGRDFRAESAADTRGSIVINEAAAAFFGLEDPVGQRFTLNDGLSVGTEAMVVGVVKDFHQTSLHEPVRPVFFFLDDFSRQILLRIDTERVAELVDGLNEKWSAVVPEWPLETAFLDDRFEALYTAERRLGRIFGAFSFLAIFVACLGLFGLSAYMAERRTREIGVRKVFGASVPGLVGLLTRDFLLLVVIAYAAAAPLTWFGMQHWLEDFAYRIQPDAGLFVITALLALAITALTVSYQAVRAALMNPIDTLRYD